MSLNCSGELKMVIRGLSMVGRSMVAHQDDLWQRHWMNSNLRPIVRDAAGGFQSTIREVVRDPIGIKGRILKSGTVAVARASMVPEGLLQFVRYFHVDSTVKEYLKVVQQARSASSDVTTVNDRVRESRQDDLVGETPVKRKVPMVKKQKLSKDSRERTVPSTQIGRLLSFGGLAAGLGMGALAEVTRRTVAWRHDDPFGIDVLLTDANVERIVRTLCTMRGGALKLGQMISLQDESVVGPRVAKMFDRVRDSADCMPTWQAEKVLSDEFGSEWRSRLASFEPKPFAAASIGQVHLGEMHDGRQVAIKIQYPGVADSIESDIRNLTATLKVWNILPPGLFIENVIAVARRELALEVDYVYEADCARRFRRLLKPYPEYYVPEVIDSLSGKRVYTTELIDGVPLDKCVEMDQETRNDITARLLRLTFLELYHFRFMQTDPNWSNFFYNPETKRLTLLDFGASKEYSKQFVDKYLRVIKAAVDGDRGAVLEHSRKLGFLTGYETKVMENAHVDATVIIGKAFAVSGPYDLGNKDLMLKLKELVPVMLSHRLRPPPDEVYSLHRKIMGTFSVAAKLKAKVNCNEIFKETYDNYHFD